MNTRNYRTAIELVVAVKVGDLQYRTHRLRAVDLWLWRDACCVHKVTHSYLTAYMCK